MITMEDQVKLLMQRIQELQKERDNVPKHQVQVIESITEDINYYQNQIDFMVNEVQSHTESQTPCATCTGGTVNEHRPQKVLY